eukprot:11530566-Alexandrium_andersonii.AAC.1
MVGPTNVRNMPGPRGGGVVANVVTGSITALSPDDFVRFRGSRMDGLRYRPREDLLLWPSQADV